MGTTGAAAQPLRQNEVINERNKERFVFHASPGGEVLPFDFFVGPGGGFVMKHFHAHQHETFRCVSGELTVHLADGERVVRPGEVLEVTPGMVHAFSNRGDVELVCAVEYRPAGRNEAWLKLVNTLENQTGAPAGLLDIAPFILDVGIFIDGPPRWLQVALFSVLKPIAILLGKKRAALAAVEAVYGTPFRWD